MATATSTDRLYEGLFLLNPGAAADMAGALDHVREILTRGGAEIVTLRKWDDRRLAYAIRNQKRGTYLISFFRVPSQALAQIDRDCNLSERIVRCMITKADHFGEAELELELKEAEGKAAEAKLRGDDASDEADTGRDDDSSDSSSDDDDDDNS